MSDKKLTGPLSTLEWVDRNKLRPNDYNPNKVSKENLKLLTQSILTNGWTLPNTVNRTLTTVRAKSATEIAKTYRISVGAAKGSGRMKVKPANGTSLTGSITFAGNVIPLIDFSVSYGKNGLVNASVMRKSGGAALKHAFVANLRYGTRVFERTSTKRDSSTQLYGPSIAHMMENEDVLNNIELEAMETADKRLEHEITRILNGYGG